MSFICKSQFSEQQIISLESDGLQAISVTDLDNDGFVDIIAASKFDDKVAWYKNLDGTGDFGS